MMHALLQFITQLAPLSVVIAAMALTHNFWQARLKRDRDEATSIRTIINQLGAKAYLLNWSQIGNSFIEVGVYKVRELIENRIGLKPSVEELGSFICDQLLFEAVVQKAWQESKIIERYQLEAFEFGKLQAEFGNRVPLVHEAIEVINTRLRLLFLLNELMIFSLRNNNSCKSISLVATKTDNANDIMNELHRHLQKACCVPNEDAFSEACTLLYEFSRAVASTEDGRILKLIRRDQSYVQRFCEWLTAQYSHRRSHKQKSAIVKSLKEHAPKEAKWLCHIADRIVNNTTEDDVDCSKLKRSSKRILHAIKHYPKRDDLKTAADKFLSKHIKGESHSQRSLSALLYIRSLGVDDPDIDLFLASATGESELAKSALERGAKVDVTLQEVLIRHQQELHDSDHQIYGDASGSREYEA